MQNQNTLPLQVMESQAGFYIGRRDTDGSPYSRESQEYWPTQKEAEEAFKQGAWTQRKQY